MVQYLINKQIDLKSPIYIENNLCAQHVQIKKKLKLKLNLTLSKEIDPD